MADLMRGSGDPAASNGLGSLPSRRPPAEPAPTGSPSGPRVKTPVIIMAERQARESRKKAEAKQLEMERERAEQEARQLEERRRRNAERRAAGVAATQGSTSLDAQAPVDHKQPSQQQTTISQPQRYSDPSSAQQPNPQQSSRHRPTLSQQQVPSQNYGSSQAQPAGPQAPQPQQPGAAGAAAGDSSRRDSASTKPRNSFPHAFERWETLSAHWEGLTGYWMRKLDQNKDEINRDSVNQQLARQVTDLSAAGANLFHAVVELQRLRASSERKFQRWFFETRSELERSQEVNGMLERALEEERRGRADAIRDAVDHERGTSRAQQQLSEMRKELAISKEEARRAWEELGRRENEERERTLSLQAGQPTIVGGVQVVPMTHGAPSRHASARDQGQADYAQAYQPEVSQAPPVQPSTSVSASNPEAYYRSQDAAGHHSPTRGGRATSEDGSSDDEYERDERGNFMVDRYGRKIRRHMAPSTASGSDVAVDEYETPATTNPPSGGHEPQTQHIPPQAPQPPTVTSAGGAQWTGAYSDTQDYSGQGYGAPGWETVPRHHHPTRLSDVIEEEDERSRASTSHVSRR